MLLESWGFENIWNISWQSETIFTTSASIKETQTIVLKNYKAAVKQWLPGLQMKNLRKFQIAKCVGKERGIKSESGKDP